MVALQYCMSAILTNSKIKDNYFRNFSQSALFLKTKLTAELKNMLEFLRAILCKIQTWAGHRTSPIWLKFSCRLDLES